MPDFGFVFLTSVCLFFLVDGEILCVSVKRLARVCLRLSWDPWTACSVKHIKDPRNKSNLLPPPPNHLLAITLGLITHACLSSGTRVFKSHEINTALLSKFKLLLWFLVHQRCYSEEINIVFYHDAITHWHDSGSAWSGGVFSCVTVCGGWLKCNDSWLNTDHNPHALHTA